jgi:Flp pilus assembly protein TadG
MTHRRLLAGDDRGAILIHVAYGVLALGAFLTLVADFGLMWTSRRQAQNSADAGALAGAIGLGYDDPTDYSDTGLAKQNAYLATQTNDVWGQAPYVNITNHITFPLVPAADCDPDADGFSQCVRVEVFRNTANVNPLPMLFGHILGLSSQNTRASAVAKVAAANSSLCLKPWGVADKWAEADGTWDPTDTFDPPADNYRYPGELSSTDPGTGYKAPPATPNDYGTELTLKVGQPGDTINPGWFQALDLGVCGHGAACYRDEISGCVNSPYGIGDDAPKKTGNMVGPTAQGVGDLISLDSNASWDPATKSIMNSCVGPPYTCSQPGYIQSPRVVAIPVFDLELYLQTGGPGNGTVRIVNILGFFVDRMGGFHGNDVVGYLINKKEVFDPSHSGVPTGASFIKSVWLIR